ncbi:MAG: polysaccharide deacetylase family protein [Nitrospirae bacterium]|nr:polysaccharide deacetylase family protein [Nitrospirota bacterium]
MWARPRVSLIGLFATLLMAILPPSARGADDGTIPEHAVVLMYHQFGQADTPSTNIRLKQFDAHLDHLAAGGYQVWPLQRVVEHLTGGAPLPDRVVAITMDDAYASIHTHAYPRLKARGWPFTVFVATDGVDQEFPAYLDWGRIREMAAHGATFANHTASHDHLAERLPGEDSAAWRARVTADIRRGQERLTAELGTAPMLFAYPYGEFDTELANLVARMGYTAFGQQSGPIGRHSDRRALPRFPMAEAFGDAAEFAAKVATLPFPLAAVSPWDPTAALATNPPTLAVTLHPGPARLDALTCYASGQGAATVTWPDREGRRFAVRAALPLTGPRGRYNCTAPSPVAGRYFWYSHPWLVGRAPANRAGKVE